MVQNRGPTLELGFGHVTQREERPPHLWGAPEHHPHATPASCSLRRTPQRPLELFACAINLPRHREGIPGRPGPGRRRRERGNSHTPPTFREEASVRRTSAKDA